MKMPGMDFGSLGEIEHRAKAEALVADRSPTACRSTAFCEEFDQCAPSIQLSDGLILLINCLAGASIRI